MLLAHHSWATTEASAQVTLPHDGQPLRGVDVPRVQKTVKLGGVLVDLEKTGVIDFFLSRRYAP